MQVTLIYQYPPSYDNLEVASSEIGYNTLLSDDDFINSVYDVDRQVSGDLFDVDRQVGAEQFIVTDNFVESPPLGDLTPLLVTSAIVVGLRYVTWNPDI